MPIGGRGPRCAGSIINDRDSVEDFHYDQYVLKLELELDKENICRSLNDKYILNLLSDRYLLMSAKRFTGDSPLRVSKIRSF